MAALAPLGCGTPDHSPGEVGQTRQALGAPAWQTYATYAVDDTVTHSGNTYRCLQFHTAYPGWEPPNVPALWALEAQGTADTGSGPVTVTGPATMSLDYVTLETDCNLDPGSCCPEGSTVVELTDGADVHASAVPDRCIVARSGSDTVAVQSSGASALLLGAGDDVAMDGPGDDLIFGGLGRDTINAYGGTNLVFGGLGNDVIATANGNNTVIPGPGTDTVAMGTGDDTLYIFDECELGWGEQFDGGVGTDTLVTPLSVAELWARGVMVANFENIVIEQNSCRSECGPPCPQVEEDWELVSSPGDTTSKSAPRDGGGALVLGHQEIRLLDSAGTSTVLYTGDLLTERPVLSSTGETFGVFGATGFALYSASGALLHTFPSGLGQYARLFPGSGSVFLPEMEPHGMEDIRAVAGRTFTSGGTQTASFATPGLRVSRLSRDHVYHATASELVRTTATGAEVWRRSAALSSIEVAEDADRVIATQMGRLTNVFHFVDGVQSPVATLDGPAWNLAISPDGTFSIATTKTSLFIFEDGALKASVALPLAYANSADVSDRGDVLIGGQDSGGVTHMMLITKFGSVAWHETGPVDTQAYRPDVDFAPNGESFTVRTKTGLTAYEIDRTP